MDCEGQSANLRAQGLVQGSIWKLSDKSEKQISIKYLIPNNKIKWGGSHSEWARERPLLSLNNNLNLKVRIFDSNADFITLNPSTHHIDKDIKMDKNVS